jgi:hypothetical protein
VDPANDTREPAAPDYVARIREFLPIDEMPPERWVALNGHSVLVGGMFACRYPDPVVDTYVRRVNELLHDHARWEELRRQWLSAEEYERVRREESAARGE